MSLLQVALFLLMCSVAQSLVCHSCDSFLSCNQPFPQECPPHSKCYTLTNHGGKNILAKGCAHSCDSFPGIDGSYCTTCHHQNFCNDRAHDIGQGAILRDGPGIGHGVEVDHGYHIGRGVRMSAGNIFSFFNLVILSIFGYAAV